MKALVLGLGNRNLGDDGLGSCLAEALAKRKPEGVEVLDGDDMGLGLVGWLEGYDLVVFVDAAADVEDVQAFLIEPEKASLEEAKDLVQDSHKAGPVTLAVLASKSGILRGKAYFVAFKPERLCFMCPVSEEALGRALKAVELINKILEKEGFNKFKVEDLKDELIRICSEGTAEAPWAD